MRNKKIQMGSAALLALLALAAAACGDAAAPEPQARDLPAPVSTTAPPIAAVPAEALMTTDPPPTTVAPTTTVTPATTVAPTTTVTPTTTVDETTAATVPVTPTTVPELRGEPYEDMYGPTGGEEIGVVGVASDDVLNVRARPGADQPIITMLDPLARGISATGRYRLLSGNAVWQEVTVGETTGWAHSKYLSRLGDPRDLTPVDTTLTADTLAGLGWIVAEGFVGTDDQVDASTTITLTMGPRGEHDIGEVVYDVIGFADDSVSGIRLRVYGRPTDDRTAFELVNVEGTMMCWRGVHEGLCV